MGGAVANTASGTVVTHQLPQNQSCKFMFNWAPTGGTVTTAIDDGKVLLGDLWIIQILPYSINKITMGFSISGSASLIVNTSGWTDRSC